MELLGRRAECEVLEGALADALGGRSRVIVLRGEAGIGKTALLDFVSGRLDGWRVTGAVGLEAELELAYSGLHQICSPMLDELERIPRPQRDALATVFGLIEHGLRGRCALGQHGRTGNRGEQMQEGRRNRCGFARISLKRRQGPIKRTVQFGD